jgi:hypothetical protein
LGILKGALKCLSDGSGIILREHAVFNKVDFWIGRNGGRRIGGRTLYGRLEGDKVSCVEEGFED